MSSDKENRSMDLEYDRESSDKQKMSKRKSTDIPRRDDKIKRTKGNELSTVKDKTKPLRHGYEANVLGEDLSIQPEIVSKLKRIDGELLRLDKQLQKLSVSDSDVPCNDIRFKFLPIERVVVKWCRDIDEILSENIKKPPTNQSNDLNSDVCNDTKLNENSPKFRGWYSNKTDHILQSHGTTNGHTSTKEGEEDADEDDNMAQEPNNVTMEDLSNDQQNLNQMNTKYMGVTSENSPSSNQGSGSLKTSKATDPMTQTDGLEEISSSNDDYGDRTLEVMAPPNIKSFNDFKSPRNRIECPTPSYYTDDNIISIYVESPLRNELDAIVKNFNPKEEANVNNFRYCNIQEDEFHMEQTNDENITKKIEINIRVDLKGTSKIFRKTCEFFARDDKCKIYNCLFRHEWPDIKEAETVLTNATRSQLIDEYNKAQKKYYAKKRYIMCFVKECIKRRETRILLEITFDVIKRKWFERDGLVNEVLEASLSQLLNSKLDIYLYDDILLLREKNKVLHDELILAIIRSDYAEMARYESVLKELVNFVLVNKAFFNIIIAQKLLFKLTEVTTFSTCIAEIATIVLCNTNPSIYKTHSYEMSIFMKTLKQKNAQLFDKICGNKIRH